MCLSTTLKAFSLQSTTDLHRAKGSLNTMAISLGKKGCLLLSRLTQMEHLVRSSLTLRLNRRPGTSLDRVRHSNSTYLQSLPIYFSTWLGLVCLSKLEAGSIQLHQLSD